MKNKIIKNIVVVAVLVNILPTQLFAQYTTSNVYLDSSTYSDIGYTSPTYSDIGYTSPTYSNIGYTSPTYSNTGYTSPTYSGTGYTSPTYSNTGYTSPTYSGTGYTSPTYSGTGYTSPTYSDTGYTSPTYSGTGYTSPTYSSTGYTSPSYSNTGYTSPTYSGTNYVQSTYTSQPYIPSTYTSPASPPVTTTTTISCPTGSTLINGQCLSTVTGTVITTTSCPAGTVINGTDCLNTVNGTVVTKIICTSGTLSNGQCINNINGELVTKIICPAGALLTNGQCINTITGTVVTNVICPAGSNLSNGQCNNTIAGTVVTNITCPTGSNLVSGRCINTITGTVVTNVICPAGSNLSNGQCIMTVTPPVTTVTNCPSNTTYVNGTCQQIINPPVVVNQTCWDGAIIPATSICSPQYKVCSSGVSVPINQACYVTPTPIYTPPQIIKFNNVVTSLATQVTNTSGRCNGIGLIANNAQSTGWFEYGETVNLGRTTASAQIGSANTAPFSNVLANLKPTTKYFCRAVMQNQYGIVKGEIVSFITTTKATVYVKPTVVVKKPTTKTPVKKAEILCSDGTTLQVKNQSSATLLSQGEKLVSLQIEKVSGKLTSGDSVTYKINYKNLVDTRLTGIVVKVALPQEIVFASTSVGTFDEGTRTLILNQDTIDPYTEGTILISGVVAKNAPIGKTIITNAYAVYTVPGTKTQDEVTAYVVGSIVPNTDISKSDTGVKNVVGSTIGKGFMPNTLIEWLALLAIMFIIFILGRSIYASYKDDTNERH